MSLKYNIALSSVLSACLLAAGAAEARGDGRPEWLQRDSLTVTRLGTVPSWSVTGAVSAAKGSKLEKSFTQNVLNTLYGEIPGLTVMQGSGEPGADSPSLNARGYNTLETTDRSVLIIVDGFESTLDNLSVQEIESVYLLKDATAAALYGMRAANGVLYVTTKRGSIKPLEINFSAQVGFNTPFKTPKFVDSYTYATLYNEALENDGLSAGGYDDAALEAYRTGSDPFLYPNVNWQDELLKKMSVLQNYNLNFSGGNGTVRYFALLNVSDNNGFFKGTDPAHETSSNSKYTRYNIRANVDVNITKKLLLNMTLAANIADQKGPAGGAYSIYNKAALTPPNAFPVHNPDNSYGGNSAFSNPVGDLLETGMGSYNSRNIQTNLRLSYDLSALVKGLSIAGAFSFNNYFIGNSNKSRTYPYFQVEMYDGEYYYNQFSELTSMEIDDSGADQWRNMSFTASLNFERTISKKHYVWANAEFFSDEDYKMTDTDLKDWQFPYRYIGVRGRAAYSFDQRYMAEFVFSYEGSDLYMKGKRFGFFPAVSVGWIASNEGFLKDNDVLTWLKLRASCGTVGHASVIGKRYAYFQDYRYNGGYYKGYNQTIVSGMTEDEVADRNRTWEKERRFNVGVELGLWDKLDFTFDYFLHKRSDILVPPTGAIPSVLGMSFSELNLGRTTNQGFETSLSFYDRRPSGFEYYAKGNFWFARNVIDYQAEELRLYPYQVRTGHQIGQPFGLVAEGLFRDEADIESSPVHTFSEVRPGDIKYRDMNDDGQIDNQDVCAVGRGGTPEFSGSLTIGLKFRGFDFEAMFYGVGNRTMYLSGATYWSFMNQYSAPASALGRWTEDTRDTAQYPRLSTQGNSNNTQYSSFWQRDGSFLKLRYVEIGYTLPERCSSAISASAIRFFVNGTNLFRIDKVSGIANADPENMNGFPAMRTVSLGLKLKF